MAQNPLLQDFDLPPFDQVQAAHFRPAFDEALAAHNAEIAAIAASPEPASFENTIEALERAGDLLARVSSVFFALTSAETNDALQDIEREIMPRLAAHSAAILQNPDLFARIETLHTSRAKLGLTPEALRLLERTHKNFVRAGAALDAAKRARVAAIEEELAGLSTRFQQNVLNDSKDIAALIDAGDLEGCPEFLREAMAGAAASAGHEGRYAVTLARPLVEPFLAFSARRDLRETVLKAFLARGDKGNAFDNNALIGEIMALRVERAQLMGAQSVAHFVLEDRMAKTPEAAETLMARIWAPARQRALEEKAGLEALIREEGANHRLEAWDWRYYAEKLRKARFDLDESEVMDYLGLDQVLAAQFDVAGRLFGLSFAERRDVPVYHPDVRVWDVMRAGKRIAIFYGDFFARPGKQSGAWMNAFRAQERLRARIPLVVNVLNLSKPQDGGQSPPVSLDDARVLFHEFGHGLHGMLSDVVYPSLSGTSVATDFVELPSQIYEYWIAEPSVLKRFAKHRETGAPIPDALIEKLQKARTFNQGFETAEFMICAMADMALHKRADAGSIDPKRFEAEFRASIDAPEEIPLRHRLPHFLHLFAGDHYAAGYYAYLWSQVLDADGFAAFKEAGDPFAPEVAARLLTYVYAAGGARDEAEAYRLFRGRDPDVAPLLAKKGFEAEAA